MNKPRVVDFHIFKTEYWGCLSGIAPTSCSPELLFAEIMGVIKGSGTSAKTLKSLSRPEYVRRKAKASPAFAAETDREKVYAAFERYERQKKQLKEIDELDRVSDLLRLLKNDSTLEQLIRRCFEEIYVDGMQTRLLCCSSRKTNYGYRDPRSAVPGHPAAPKMSQRCQRHSSG